MLPVEHRGFFGLLLLAADLFHVALVQHLQHMCVRSSLAVFFHLIDAAMLCLAAIVIQFYRILLNYIIGMHCCWVRPVLGICSWDRRILLGYHIGTICKALLVYR